MFTALLLDRDGDAVRSSVAELPDDRLPPGDVTLAVRHTTLNYKDGLILAGQGGLVREYPHVGGIDLAGVVEESSHPRWRPGDAAILTGWRVGETRWGGHATRARVMGDWLVPLPAGLALRDAMAVGTAGLTAMLAILALEERGMGEGPVLVTGAAGGVGSVAVALLHAMGREVAAVTGRPEQEAYLRSLGAARVVPRAALAEPTPKTLEPEAWAGVVDAAGGPVLARALKQLRYGGSAAAIGAAGGQEVPMNVIPFLLRAVALLGIDSVMCPIPRREAAWARIARDLPLDRLRAMVQPATLHDLPRLGAAILRGEVRGRVVVDL